MISPVLSVATAPPKQGDAHALKAPPSSKPGAGTREIGALVPADKENALVSEADQAPVEVALGETEILYVELSARGSDTAKVMFR